MYFYEMGEPYMNKLVSILMPMFNEEKYIRESIESVLGQSYRNIEIIVVDDMSIDDSVNIVRQYQKKYHFIKLLLKSKTQLGDTRNCALELARGDYIMNMDADDVAYPTKIEEQLYFIKENGLDVSGTFVEIFGDIPIEKKIYYEKMYNFEDVSIQTLICGHHSLCNPSLMYKKSVFEKIGNYNNELINEDWDLWLRVLDNNLKIKNLNKKLFKMRKHKDSITRLRAFEIAKSVKTTKLKFSSRFFSSEIKVYAIWGAGNGGKIVKEIISELYPRWEQCIFIDTYKEGKILDIEIIKPNQINNIEFDYIFVSLAEGNMEADEYLKGLGLTMFKDYLII